MPLPPEAPEPGSGPAPDPPETSRFRRAIRWAGRGLLGVALLSVVWVLAYRWIDPPVTYLSLAARFEGRPFDQRWRPLGDISATLHHAVIAAEDARFCQHYGFDFEAIGTAFDAQSAGGRLRGASTISQQTAKNVFLWPGRSWVRKGLEAWFTLWIEGLWPKERILEVYLNVAQFGPQAFGAEAGARHWFNGPASALTRTQSAGLASLLPAPARRSPGAADLAARRGRILKGMNVVEVSGYACVQ